MKMDSTNNTKVTFARTDRATATASLFRPITRGRRPLGLKVLADYDETSLTFTSYEWLDSRDQTILLALIGMAGIESVNINSKASGELGKKLWAGLSPTNSAEDDSGAVVKTTLYKLLQAAGMPDSTATYTRVKEILERLSMVGCTARSGGWQWSMRFLSYAFHEDGRLVVALNARFAQALTQGSTYARINLEERRSLEGDIAQLVHSWLNATVRAGNTFQIGIDKLAVRIWGVEPQSASTLTTRRASISKALKEISTLKGWKISFRGRGVDTIVTIKRPKLLGF